MGERIEEGDRPEEGMVTAEYAVGVVAGCTLAGACLYPLFRSEWMQRLLGAVFESALGGW